MKFQELKEKITDSRATLVAVSKTHSPKEIQVIYDLGEREFGENKVQELMDKIDDLPDDIKWHMIGHLQSNKVKYIAPFIHLIHSLDRISLAKEINKEGRKAGRVIPTLLQIKIAEEDSKFGLDIDKVDSFMDNYLKRGYENIRISGIMGMATFTEDEEVIKNEFQSLESIFLHLKEKYFANDSEFSIRSYGMSSDYEIALESGSNMVRIGSLIFGERTY